jgi:hypothetical protein
MLSQALAYAEEEAKRMDFLLHFASDIQLDSCCDPLYLGLGLLVTPCQFAEFYASTGSA